MNYDLDKIKELNYSDRIKLLDDYKFREMLFLVNQSQDIKNFDKTLELFSVKDLLKGLTKDIIFKIKKMYSGIEYYFLEQIKNKNIEEFEYSLKNNNDLLELLLYSGEKIYKNLSFSYNTVLYIIDYIDKNNIDYSKTCLFYIMFASLKNIDYQKKFLYEKINDFYKIKMLNIFKKELVLDYIENNIINLKNIDIYNLITLSNLNINSNLYNNKSFIKDCIIKDNLYESRINLEKFINLSGNYSIEDIYLKEEIKLLKSFNIETNNFRYDGIFNNLITDKNTINLLREIVIDLLFHDSSNNVYLNLIELLDFTHDKTYLSKDKLILYKELLSIYKGNSKEILDFYNKYKSIDLISNFYDDLRYLKNISYQMIKDSCLKIEDISYLKNHKLTKEYNVDIYELDGEMFTMLVSCRQRIPSGNNSSPRNCYTLIGNKNMRVMNENSYIYGYLDFNIDNIMHVYEADAFSQDLEEYTTSYVNRIRYVNEILNSNHKSEIQIKNNKINNQEYERLLPSYIICFDELNEKAIEASKKLNIPIIIINRSLYKPLTGNKNIRNYEKEYTLLPYMQSSHLEKYEYRKKN